MRRKMKFKEIRIDGIELSPANVRKADVEEGLDELARSISEIGLQQPVVVYQEDEKYKLIIGQRRYLACKKLGWQRIPALIRHVESETEARIVSFSENIHRLDLDYRDKMRVAAELRKSLKSVNKVAQRLGVSGQTVRNYLGYEGVPERLKELVDQRKISAQTALAISRSVPEEDKAVQIAEKVREAPTSERRRNLIEVAKENPEKSADQIAALAQKQKFRQITLNLTPRVAGALEAACPAYQGEPKDIATEALEEWLGRRGFLK